MDQANEEGGLLLFIEHRYYGKSYPFGPNASYSNEGLRFLTVEQAMADFNAITLAIRKVGRGALPCLKLHTCRPLERLLVQTCQRQQQWHGLSLSLGCSPAVAWPLPLPQPRVPPTPLQAYNVPRSAKNVGYGGSYTGSVAAYMRLRYPQTFHAVLASSSVVKFLFGTEAWERTKFFSAISIGNSIAEVASPSCKNAVAAGLTALRSPAGRTNEGRLQLAAAAGCACIAVSVGACGCVCVGGVLMHRMPLFDLCLALAFTGYHCPPLPSRLRRLCPDTPLNRWEEHVEGLTYLFEVAFWGAFQASGWCRYQLFPCTLAWHPAAKAHIGSMAGHSRLPLQAPPLLLLSRLLPGLASTCCS